MHMGTHTKGNLRPFEAIHKNTETKDAHTYARLPLLSQEDQKKTRVKEVELGNFRVPEKLGGRKVRPRKTT
jgi:hypothetical protein